MGLAWNPAKPLGFAGCGLHPHLPGPAVKRAAVGKRRSRHSVHSKGQKEELSLAGKGSNVHRANSTGDLHVATGSGDMLSPGPQNPWGTEEERLRVAPCPKMVGADPGLWHVSGSPMVITVADRERSDGVPLS